MNARVLTVAAAICGAVLCQGCVSMKEIYQQEVVKARRPGQQMVESPETTMKRLCCPPYQKNVIYLEDTGALPERVGPGEELNHRIRYAYSPATPSNVLHGRLVRRVLYRGREVFHDVSNQAFCAGTWTIDAFIKVPRNAPSGWYSIRLEIYSMGKTIRRSTLFYVKEKNKPSMTSSIGESPARN
ncbi:hypothetical protein LPW11_03110 [Geomonas sp. RF6]|uniref:hypothetical protein n=1 Tax=Geomonas sp. RF6 TaxID=2897342 RepID=UPI001E299E92|nr:hypothetical protein [Geomonas sp. RF6]UFS71188.1 hypothetical protein LPW11_03110 [Geomonas sp. RF6]